MLASIANPAGAPPAPAVSSSKGAAVTGGLRGTPTLKGILKRTHFPLDIASHKLYYVNYKLGSNQDPVASLALEEISYFPLAFSSSLGSSPTFSALIRN